MINRSCFFMSAAIVATSLLTSCSGQTISPTNKPALTSATNSAGVVPDTLNTIEAAAEDIIDFAPSGKWDKIAADVTAIADAWKAYQPQASGDGASQATQDALASALDSLQTASAAKDAAATMQAANDLSAAVIDLFAIYDPAVPADIGRLDVLERQVILDVAANDFAAAEASLAKTKTVWESVKPSVLAHHGQDVADEFDASLAAQEAALAAKDGSALTAEAQNGLELVDDLERLY